MKAMILAAGLGTRLRPLTDSCPKALVELSGRTLLEITVTRLRSQGVTELMVNIHHFADPILDFLKSKNNFGMRIEISREDLLLDTGGGLRKASWFFLEDPNRLDEPFLLHNVDVVSTIDLLRMIESHKKSQALATLAVQHRDSSRHLLFDQHLQLSGRRIRKRGEDESLEIVRNIEPLEPLAFSGIHVLSPRLLPLIGQTGVFSIIDTYLQLAAQNQKIFAFRADQYYWRDLGRPSDLAQAAKDFPPEA